MDEEITEISSLSERLLEKAGRILYITKSMRAPTAILNSNVFNAETKRIWFGDIEIEGDGKALIKLSVSIGLCISSMSLRGGFSISSPRCCHISYLNGRYSRSIYDYEIYIYYWD